MKCVITTSGSMHSCLVLAWVTTVQRAANANKRFTPFIFLRCTTHTNLLSSLTIGAIIPYLVPNLKACPLAGAADAITQIDTTLIGRTLHAKRP